LARRRASPTRRPAASSVRLCELLDPFDRRLHVALELLEPAGDDPVFLLGHRGDGDGEAGRRGTDPGALPEPDTVGFLLELETPARGGDLGIRHVPPEGPPELVPRDR